MNKIPSFQEFIATQSMQIPVSTFMMNFFLVVTLSILLDFLYRYCGNSLSNRRMFGKNFLLLSVVTMLVISVVKSSLALSLGLVGALSIVRFRAAIKEPEELVYLFFAIAIGLGMGADQAIITVLAFCSISIVMIIIKIVSKKFSDQKNINLTVSTDSPGKVTLENIVEKLKGSCSRVVLKRFNEDDKFLEALFLVEFTNFNKLSAAKSALQEIDQAVKIDFLDSEGII